MVKKEKEPTTKADNFVEWENKNKPEKYTNFEELYAKFNELTDVVDEIVAILHENNLTRTKTIEVEYYDESKVYKKLEEEDNE